LISNSAIHHGLGFGAQILYSQNVVMKNNSLFDFVRVGINIQSSFRIKIDGNVVGHIRNRNLGELLDGLTDPNIAISGCAF